MADYKVTDTELASIANAIRAKTGKSAQIEFPTEFVSEIGSISGGSAESANLFNILAFRNVPVKRGSLSVSGDSITITSGSAGNAFTAFRTDGANLDQGGGFPAPCTIPISPGQKIKITWNYSGDSTGAVFIFENGSNESYESIDKSVKVFEKVASNGTSFMTYRFDVVDANSSITYSNIKIVVEDV